MDVADRIVVRATKANRAGRHPDELYEHSADDFVMSFLGPVTRLGDALIRPHDIEILPSI